VVETFLVPETASIAGKTLGEIDLRSRTGVTVIAVVRNEKPGADQELISVFRDTMSWSWSAIIRLLTRLWVISAAEALRPV